VLQERPNPSTARGLKGGQLFYFILGEDVYTHQECEHAGVPLYHPGGFGGGISPRLSEVEPVAVRGVEVAIGAAVWVVKAVEVVEVRWSELPPRSRLVFLAPGLEGALGERQRQPRPPLLSRQSARGRERLSWRVRLSRSLMSSPRQAQAPGAVAWPVALHSDASVAAAQHLSAKTSAL
jgi:hypothetical protein